MPEMRSKSMEPVAVPPQEAMQAVASHFVGSDGLLPEIGPRLSIEDVHRYLAGRIQHLLDERPELLLSILYRIDVPEKAALAVFAGAPVAEIADRLADLVLERQLEKIEIRRRYARERPCGGESRSDPYSR